MNEVIGERNEVSIRTYLHILFEIISDKQKENPECFNLTYDDEELEMVVEFDNHIWNSYIISKDAFIKIFNLFRLFNL
jgi:hypothetical protein